MPATLSVVAAPDAFHQATKLVEPASPPSESITFLPCAWADCRASRRLGCSVKSVVLSPPPLPLLPLPLPLPLLPLPLPLLPLPLLLQLEQLEPDPFVGVQPQNASRKPHNEATRQTGNNQRFMIGDKSRSHAADRLG